MFCSDRSFDGFTQRIRLTITNVHAWLEHCKNNDKLWEDHAAQENSGDNAPRGIIDRFMESVPKLRKFSGKNEGRMGD